MIVYYHKNFKKQFRKLPKKITDKFLENLKIFISKSNLQKIHNHQLHGKWASYRSINITADLRAIYRIEGDIIVFVAIGSHSELYLK